MSSAISLKLTNDNLHHILTEIFLKKQFNHLANHHHLALNNSSTFSTKNRYIIMSYPNQNLPIIHALWIGDTLGKLSAACLSSFLFNKGIGYVYMPTHPSVMCHLVLIYAMLT